MSYLSRYEIAFKGLKEGKHQFDYELDEKFFEKFENSEVEKGTIDAQVVLIKSSALLTLEMTVKGQVELMCHRCLDNYWQPVYGESRLFIKFGAESDEMSHDLIVIPNNSDHINAAQYLYELVILSLPIMHVHLPDQNGKSTCNTEMIKKLNQYLVTEEESTKNAEPKVDERWNDLRKLIDNKKK
jgi:uncharacterized metal-binding protein YceD (DUF177 family)